MTSETALGEWVRVAKEEDLWEGELLEVGSGRDTAIVIRLPGGEVRAYQGICPHQETLLADGDVDVERGILTCSSHLWQFRLSDGTGVNPASCRLARYDVRLQDGYVYLRYPEHPAKRFNRCRE